ncbi:phosphoribosylformylglycinamidine synthase I [Legionella israelensis]|uniref:Phosphoribosylformylglycinamidine synthase I n=2 Tax=Legionella israelensis TaxID=454 RepID=A0AAX1EGA7_9GAMM|nr:phosphoribosylformylglycinamidine synthase I [Legionella israelensis]
MMKIAVIQFPGSNCERETILAIKRAGMEAVEFLWNEPADKLRRMDGYVIAGGFSYEDRSRAGIIAALDPVMQEIKQQSEKGKPVLGICNGAQILVESGLVPGFKDYQLGMALTENKRISQGKILGTGFYNTWVHLCANKGGKNNAFTRRMNEGQMITVPSAHAEGRFVMPQELLNEIEKQGLNCFLYCDEQGAVRTEFPVNPNGSVGNIAAISNATGNVMAIMPHPERTTAGDVLFLSMRDYIAEGSYATLKSLNYTPERSVISSYKRTNHSDEILVQMIINDNHALTVQNTLHHMDIPVNVKRWVHWEIESQTVSQINEIKKTGVLFNERKEIAQQAADISMDKEHSLALLVRAKENIIGQQKQQTLKDHFFIEGIKRIQQGVLWIFTCKNGKINELSDLILNSNIVCNPYAYDCYFYDTL